MKAKRMGWLASLLLAVTLTAGCFGPMNLSSKLGTWNRGIENRWAAEAVFLPLRIFYVYTVCFLGDILIFNTIEFWGGSNPISPVDPERAAAVKALEAERNG
jgi:hypothetical protein